MIKQVKTLRGHTTLARFLATVTETGTFIQRHTNIPSPYAYSPSHIVYRDADGYAVIIIETRHAVFTVWRVGPDESRCDSDGGQIRPSVAVGG